MVLHLCFSHHLYKILQQILYKITYIRECQKINSHGLYIFLHILKTRAKLSIQSGL